MEEFIKITEKNKDAVCKFIEGKVRDVNSHYPKDFDPSSIKIISANSELYADVGDILWRDKSGNIHVYKEDKI